MTLGKRFRAARKRAGFTLRQVADMTGESVPHLSLIEGGKIRDPQFCRVVRLARALDVSLDRLASFVPERKPKK